MKQRVNPGGSFNQFTTRERWMNLKQFDKAFVILIWHSHESQLLSRFPQGTRTGHMRDTYGVVRTCERSFVFFLDYMDVVRASMSPNVWGCIFYYCHCSAVAWSRWRLRSPATRLSLPDYTCDLCCDVNVDQRYFLQSWRCTRQILITSHCFMCLQSGLHSKCITECMIPLYI